MYSHQPIIHANPRINNDISKPQGLFFFSSRESTFQTSRFGVNVVFHTQIHDWVKWHDSMTHKSTPPKMQFGPSVIFVDISVFFHVFSSLGWKCIRWSQMGMVLYHMCRIQSSTKSNRKMILRCFNWVAIHHMFSHRFCGAFWDQLAEWGLHEPHAAWRIFVLGMDRWSG